MRKVEKANLYFPIIERVFREENLPDDFKYLVIQESALIADAVSSSNAVGFWQFKKASAEEVGLRVDKHIDERMHITSSSRAAAKYLKKNNFFFDNWLFALLAYNTGAGGAEQHIEKKYIGKKKMDITKKTHWYVKKFLAHKIAYENEINLNFQPHMKLYEYENTKDKSLQEISDFFEIDHQLMVDYNKWLRKGKIPSEKVYPAIIPVSANDLVAQNLLGDPKDEEQVLQPKTKTIFQHTYKPISEFDFQANNDFPKVNTNSITKLKINGIPGFMAKEMDDINSIITSYDISKDKFLKYNEMTSSDIIIPGQVYYLKSKKRKAKIHYHVVMPGENAWAISQKYGLKIKKLLTKNRMKEEKDLSPGMVMWLRFIRPSNVPVEYKEINAKNVVVESIPNEIEYPHKLNYQISQNSSKAEVVIKEETKEDDEFLFENIDEKTAYIDENSYVNLEEIANENPENESALDNKQAEIKNVKNEEIYHIVKSGETLFSISRSYQVSIGQLRQWNEIEDLDVLKVGQQLLIKIPNEVKEEKASPINSQGVETYIVKPDDTLYAIARKYNLSIKELMDMNNMADFNLKEGQIIKITPQR